jgi:hypothetical protein
MPAESLNWGFRRSISFLQTRKKSTGNRMPCAGVADPAKRASRRQKMG